MSITPATPSLLDDDSKPRRKARWVLVLVIVLLLAIFVPPFISLNRLKGRVASSLSAALGRQVSVGSITLRLLPRPGFDLSNVTIDDDPAFSVEPMLHADAVTASLRLSSLWRRRVEIASLSFQAPSVNLVRDQQGRWNVGALLQRAQQIPTAPTSKVTSESRPRFPYLEANDARINFKVGLEKKAYGLAEGDVALWLAAEDEWHIRMEARPIRSDRNLHDTGTMQLEGTFQRASDPRQTPLNLAVSIQNGQLGQLSEFVYGRDRGWRGGLDAAATVAGTPADLQLTLEATLDDFRRYDITGSDSARIRARCTARYSDTAETPHSLNAIDCRVPAGNGEVTARGSVQDIFRIPRYDLSIAVSHLPGSVLASAARRMKKGVIADLSASGEANAAFTIKSVAGSDASPVIAGGGALRNIRITSRLIKPDFLLGDVQFSLDRNDAKPAKRGKRDAQAAGAPSDTTLRISSTRLPLGLSPNRVLFLEGVIHPTDFSLSLRGQTDLERAIPVVQALGFEVPRAEISGIADVNVVANGVGRGFPAPWLEGKVSLTGFKARGGGLPAPVNVDYGTVDFTRERAELWMQEATLTGSSIRTHGTVSFSQGCGLETCPVRFSLASNELRLDDLNSLVAGSHDHPWYSFGKRDNQSGGVSQSGEGNISIGRLFVKTAAFNGFSAFVHFGEGKLDLTNITTDVGSGKHLGELHATFTGDEPQYDVAGTVSNASLDSLGSSLWPTSWRASPVHGGTLDAKYRLRLTGRDAATLFKSAEGAADLSWRSGTFTGHAGNGAAQVLAVKEFSDHVSWTDGTLHVLPAVIKTANGSFDISGTFARTYDLRVLSGGKPMLVAFGTMTPLAPVTAKK